jgi:hypothetical protein
VKVATCVCVSARSSRACVNKGSTGADPRLLFLRLVLIFIPLTVLLYLYVHLYSPALILLVKGGPSCSTTTAVDFSHSIERKIPIFSLLLRRNIFWFCRKNRVPPLKKETGRWTTAVCSVVCNINGVVSRVEHAKGGHALFLLFLSVRENVTMVTLNEPQPLSF